MVEIDEEQIDAAMAVMSCSPAYVRAVAEALGRAGVERGPGARARRASWSPETLAGTAELLRSATPERSARAVAPPGGATRGGPRGAFERGGFEAAFADGGEARRWSGSDDRLLALAIGRDDIADYVEALFLVYLILIFIRVLLSWVPRMPYNRYLRARRRASSRRSPTPTSTSSAA